MVKGVVVAGNVDGAEVVAVDPVTLASQLRLNALEEARTRQRIGERDANVVGSRIAHQLYCLADLGPAFPWVAELKEVARPYAGGSEPLSSGMNSGELQTLFHRVENLLRTRFDAHPYFDAARSFQSRDGRITHQVGARLNLEGNDFAMGLDDACKLSHPVAIQRKHIIAKPDMLDAEERLEFMNFRRNLLRRS